MATNLSSFTDILTDVEEIADSQPISLSNESDFQPMDLDSGINIQRSCNSQPIVDKESYTSNINQPAKYTGQRGEYRSVEEIDKKYRCVFTYPLFNLVQSKVIDDALYSDKSMVVCAPTGSGKTVVFEMAIVQLLKELDEKNYKDDFKIIYMAPVKSLCTERLTEWYSKFTPLGLLCVEVTGDTDVDFPQLKPYRIIITTPEKWDILTRRWRDHRCLVEVIKLFLIDEVHILNDNTRGPVLEAVVSRMKTIESSAQSAYRIEQLQQQYQESSAVGNNSERPPRIRFVAVSATVNNPDDVAAWLGTSDRPAVFYKFGDECRPVKLNRVVEGYPCPEGMSIFKFDIILNYKLWPIIQKYHNGKPTLIFCNTRKSVTLTAETLSKELTITFTPEQKAKLTAIASTIKNRKLQQLVLSGVGCHHAGLLYEERLNIEQAFRNRDLPILITTTTLAMGVNLPAHLVIIKNTQQYVNGAYQEYSISTVLQMVGRAGRPQFDTEATAVIMTRLADKPRYQLLVGGSEPLQSYLHKRLAENLNSEVALRTVSDVAQCVQWLRSTFLYVRAAKDPRWYLGLPQNAPHHHILKKIEELCVKAMNGLASAGLITMDEASCIESTEAGRLMSLYYLDLETMKHIMKIQGTETLDQILWIVCESHELADMHLRVDERRCLNALNRNNQAATIRFPMKGKINSREMKLNCMIQAVLGCLPITEPALNQESLKVMRIADRVCKCLVAYVTRPDLVNEQPKFYSAILNSIVLAKCIAAHLWENSPYVSKQLKGIGPTFSTLLASAGKVNFLLLEESHPRDLERIMNKSAPTGNLIRKQISLLPKYQITATPVDEKRVNIQLSLINHAYLAENTEQLTAGANHKSFIVIGDSENHLLLLASFKDKDLISVYDGLITYEITRKHSFEHKILAHCISSNYVGIDVQCEYVFKSLESTFCRGEVATPNITPLPASTNRNAKKQTCITDVFKERKRKINEDITQSKEKKKRENALMSKLKILKDSIESASKEARDDIVKSNEMYCEMSQSEILEGCSTNYKIPGNTNFVESKILSEYEYPDTIADVSAEDIMADEKIECILKEIEMEISNNQELPKIQDKGKSTRSSATEDNQLSLNLPQSKSVNLKSINFNNFKSRQFSKRKPVKSNYNFMEHLEKNYEPNNDDQRENQNSFSNTIKCQIEDFLEKARKTSHNQQNDQISNLLYDTPNEEAHQTGNQLHPLNVDEYSLTINEPEIPPTANVHRQFPEPEKNDVDNKKILDSSYDDHSLSFVPEKENLNICECPNSTPQSTPHFAVSNLEDTNKNSDTCSNTLENHCLETELPTIDLSLYPKKQSELPIIDLTNDNCTVTDKMFKREKSASIFITSVPSETLSLTKCFLNNSLRKDFDYFKPKGQEIIGKRATLRELQDLTNKSLTVALNSNVILNSSQTMKFDPKQDISMESIDELQSFAIVKPSEQYNPNKVKAMSTHELIITNKSHGNSRQNQEMVLQNEVVNFNEIVPKQIVQNTLTTEFVKNLALTSQNQQITEDPSTGITSNFLLKNNQPVNHYVFDILKSDSNIRNEDKFETALEESKPFTSSMRKFNNSKESPSRRAYSENNEHINKFSFTTTKIDITTKNNPDRNIKIIRKVKLDVDVTEIISKVKNDNIHNNNNRNVVLSEPKSLNKNTPTINSCDNLNLNLTYDMHKDEMQLNEIVTTEVNKNSVAQKELADGNIFNKSKKIFSSPHGKTIGLVKPNHLEDTTSEEINKQEYKDISRSEINFQREDYCKHEKNTNDKNKEVKNILAKYSKILKKNNDASTTNENRKLLIEMAKTKDNLRENKPNSVIKTIQTNRAYRISKLNDSNVPIPKVIVEVSKKSTPTTIPTSAAILSKIKSIETTTSEGDNKSDNNHLIRDNHIVNEIQDSQEIDCATPTPPLATQEALLNEIDQSMFNPKTVLQCFSRESPLFIPPPPEFCDETSYSPTHSEFGVNDNELEVNEFLTEETKENIFDIHKTRTEFNRSIFENYNNINILTPTKEIETWTLSKDDEFEPSFQYSSNPLKSCTVMRKNSSIMNDADNSYLNSRSNKLHNFKFTPKNKLRF